VSVADDFGIAPKASRSPKAKRGRPSGAKRPATLEPRLAAMARGMVEGKTAGQALMDASPPGTFTGQHSANNTASQILGRKEIREAFQREFAKAGVTPELAATVVLDAMTANKVGQNSEGEPVDLGPDHVTRLAGYRAFARLTGAEAPKQEERLVAKIQGVVFMPAKAERKPLPIVEKAPASAPEPPKP
jgi:hypothetical protein